MRIQKAVRALLACSIFILVTPLAAEPVLNFIPHTHPHPFEFQAFNERVAESQFEVLRALSRLPGATVFMEGETHDTTERRTFVSSPTQGVVMPIMVFFGRDSKFLSKRYQDLTTAQRYLLYEEGGARIALDLGFINRIKAVDNPEELNADEDWVRAGFERLQDATEDERREWVESPEFQARVFERRELETLKRARNFVLSAEYMNEPLAVIYGSKHMFNAAAGFSDYFSFNFTRVCESLVIEMPAPKSKMQMLMPDGSVRTF
jgi:hypothetical protein